MVMVLAPSASDVDVVDVAVVPGALSAVVALVAAFDALVAALFACVVVLLKSVVSCPITLLQIAMSCTNVGINRERCPPLASPVVALASSVTVLPSPPSAGGKVTEAIKQAPLL
jgi:hypothetical protein